jgi:hypothetical protein
MGAAMTAVIPPAATRSADSGTEVGADSPNAQICPPDTSAIANRNESAEGYSRVVAVLNGKWRVIECRDAIQWILQSRDTTKAASSGAWRGRSYCRTKEALLRICRVHAGTIDPSAAAILAALPDRIDAPLSSPIERGAAA